MTTATTDPTRLTTPAELRLWSQRCRAAGMDVGLVPTMGALHDGHLSLVRRARRECDRVVVSIFANVLQFDPREDIDSYPRAVERDIALLAQEGVHAVFVPTAGAMYPAEFATTVHVDEALTGILEGVHRPGHFDGVAVVVAKLLIAAGPRRAYFGQKDSQQSLVVRRLARDLDTGVDIVVCPVVRDLDGLALSSRNVFLSADERRRAVAIPTALGEAVRAHAAGERRAAALRSLVVDRLERAGFDIDYVAVVDPETLVSVDAAGPGCQVLVAGRIGATRLIDVIRLGIDESPMEANGAQDPEVADIMGVQGRD
ncbi:MAG: pantoate--beta-alanine ligase [Candidatus Dormibacteraeota bacterium]|nr:pantoate--beta-alanine ligase [Candidatus Dormibacteraeota bacterium]